MADWAASSSTAVVPLTVEPLKTASFDAPGAEPDTLPVRVVHQSAGVLHKEAVVVSQYRGEFDWA